MIDIDIGKMNSKYNEPDKIIENLQSDKKNLKQVLDGTTESWFELKKENKRLREYAQHKRLCSLNAFESDVLFESDGLINGKIKCTCGLDEALKGK